METVLLALIPTLFVVMLVAERIFPARPLPKIRFWLAKGIFFFVLSGVLNAIVPALLVEATGGYALVNLSKLPLVVGAALGLLVADFVLYWAHRAMHNIHFIWRWVHQMHHSAERLDIAGALYFHPLDLLVNIGVTTFAATLLGLSGEAAALAGLASFFYALFQHFNVRTPRWLGYVIQRPEAHSIHHGRNVHAYNYANFPMWDVLFGTFRNPAGYHDETGFWDGGSRKLFPMLFGRDIAPPGTVGGR